MKHKKIILKVTCLVLLAIVSYLIGRNLAERIIIAFLCWLSNG